MNKSEGMGGEWGWAWVTLEKTFPQEQHTYVQFAQWKSVIQIIFSVLPTVAPHPQGEDSLADKLTISSAEGTSPRTSVKAHLHLM